MKPKWLKDLLKRGNMRSKKDVKIMLKKYLFAYDNLDATILPDDRLLSYILGGMDVLEWFLGGKDVTLYGKENKQYPDRSHPLRRVDDISDYEY